MNVRVHRHKGRIIENIHHNFCGFDADTRKRLKCFEIIRNLLVVFFSENFSSFPNISRFISKKIDISQIIFDFFERNPIHIARIFDAFKKRWRHAIDLFVGRLRGQNHRTKQLKWRFVVEFDFSAAVFTFDIIQCVFVFFPNFIHRRDHRH